MSSSCRQTNPTSSPTASSTYLLCRSIITSDSIQSPQMFVLESYLSKAFPTLPDLSGAWMEMETSVGRRSKVWTKVKCTNRSVLLVAARPCDHLFVKSCDFTFCCKPDMLLLVLFYVPSIKEHSVVLARVSGKPV